MRIFLAMTIVAAALCSSIGITSAQSANDLFQKALSKERVDGQLTEAIALYERVVKESSGDRALSAKALLQIGRCYQRLGRPEAQATFERILRQYPDQSAVVDESRARLASLVRPSGPPLDQASRSPQARRFWEGAAAGQSLGSPSPDGRFISFVDWDTLDVALWEVATGTQRRLTNDGWKAGGSPYWSRISHDGHSVAFTFFADDGSSDLRLVRLDNPAVNVLYRNADVSYVQPFDWSPDSTRLLMVLAMPDRTNRIAIFSLADRSVHVLKTLDWRQPAAMSFSPDGRWIVYDLQQHDTGGERDLFLLAVDGSRETRLVDHPADDFLLGWAPAGNTVLFASDRTGVPAAWALDVADGRPGGPPRFVRGDLGWRIHPMGFSRRGAFFYFVENTFSDVYTAALGPGSGSSDALTAVGGRYAGTYQSADWSPDGRELALVVNRAGLRDRQLIVQSMADGRTRELQPDLNMFTWPRWAPDAKSILVSGRDRKGRQGFFRVDAASGGATELVREESGSSLHLRAEWAPDGQNIFYVRKDSTCACIVKRDVATGRDAVIHRLSPRGTLVLIAPSPDGQWIAVSTRDDSRIVLMVIPAAGGEERVIAEGETLKWFNFVTWTRDGRELLFGRAAGAQRVDVWRAPIAGGAARPAGLSMHTLRDLRVHPDGRRVVFASGENKGELWMMEHFLPARSTKPTSAR